MRASLAAVGRLFVVRVVLVQAASGIDKAANLASVTQLLTQAERHQPDLVVFPEAFMHDFGKPDSRLAPVAEALDGPFVSLLAQRARALGSVVIAGMFEQSADAERPYNTVVALGADGKLLASYRKAHLYDSFGYRESDRLLAGEPRPVVIDVDGFAVGLMTCYDLRFPEFGRLLVDAGATAVAVPAAWVRGPLKEDHWETLVRARAIENTCFVFGAAQCGPHYAGRSMVVDPMGVALASLGEGPGLAVAEVDADRIEEVRRVNPSLLNRRLT
jgi:deaminated glutathione amidase